MKQFHHYSEELLITRNKAKWVFIGDFAESISRGQEISKAQLNSGDYPAVKCGDINSVLPQNFKNVVSFVNYEIINNKKHFKSGDIVVGAIAHSNNVIGTAKGYIGNEQPLAGLGVLIITHQQNTKYLSYSLSTLNYRKQIKKLVEKGTIFNLYPRQLEKIKIPLPSLEEQEKIVKKLDLFYEHLEQLKTKISELIELNKLRIQYYINKLTQL